jgi:competence protein ComEC
VAILGRMLLGPLEWLLAARGQLFVWVPVFIGFGIGIWFSLPFEPVLWHYVVLFALFILGAVSTIWGPDLGRPMFLILCCVTAGGIAAGIRAHLVAGPMIEFQYYGPVTGRVVDIDRSQSDALRITLSEVVLDNVDPAPRFVRVSIQGAAPEPAQMVMLTAFLSAPSAATEPDGFDFRRTAFFRGLGAVGYTRSPVLLWQEAPADLQRVDRLRTYLSHGLMAAIPNDAGAFASGAMTGDKSGITQDTVQALRDSNLAHLLAISGMNLAFLSGFVFMLIRYGLALVPVLALRVNSKKIAAVVALGVAFFYLLLSGANVATTRAFLMIAVMLGAILLDRQGLTMRSVAISAVILLLWQPESLLDPGFQLSYAATVVLIGAYHVVDRQILAQKLPRWMMPVYAVVLTSVLAGIATAPFAAAHFNRFTDYGLLANLLTAPAMSLLMAAGAVVAILAPFGLAAPALWVLEQASAWILFVAHWVSGLQGAVTMIVVPPAVVLPLISVAGIWILVWQGRRRWLGVPFLGLALMLWGIAPRPDLLISADGRLVGWMGAMGRALSSPTGAGFSAENWLQDDGDLVTQEEAAARPGFLGPKQARAFWVGDVTGVVLVGKGATTAFQAACAAHNLVIVPAALDPSLLPDGPCTRIDRDILDNTGALGGYWRDGVLTLYPSRQAPRIWSGGRPILSPIIVPTSTGGVKTNTVTAETD